MATHIQSERLRLARKTLMDPAQRGRTIGEIAQAHGFAHRTSFIRAFERAYRVSPSQQRMLASHRIREGGSAAADHAPFRWIEIP